MGNADVRQYVTQFVQTASEYCTLIELHERMPCDQFLQRVRSVLPQLYYQALTLPECDAVGDFDREISHQQWTEIFTRLNGHLGDYDMYWEIFDPVRKTDDPVCCSLSDDLADIWRDLKNGLLYWAESSDVQRNEIVWHWRFHFHAHWSSHLVDALRVINSLIETHDVGSENVVE